ncbi:CAunnamed protein product [Biomphalaria glabrata]|uniref:Uncharacterized protein n=1 Tax=Biomphalaria glabrata TaxID=6526 RepID=A0A2C9LAH6_BIOGL|nr:CAunnamed protein product [Biomphalaria glabrata]
MNAKHKAKPKRQLSGVWKLDSQPLSTKDQNLLKSSTVHKGHKSVDVCKGNKSTVFNGKSSSTTPRLVRQIADLRFREWQEFTRSLPQLNTEARDGSHSVFTTYNQVSSIPKESGHAQEDENTKTGSKKFPQNYLGLPFLRRPRLTASTPASEDGDVFRVILKGKEMKPFSFQGDQLRAIQFYASHYPLLMRKLLDTRGSLPGSAKAITGSDVLDALKVNSADIRNKHLHEWLAKMEKCLQRFETDPGDEGAIETVLRSDIFDPTVWPWNSEKYKLPDITNSIT